MNGARISETIARKELTTYESPKKNMDGLRKTFFPPKTLSTFLS